MFYVGIVCCFIPIIAAIIIFKLKDKIKLLHQLIAFLLGLLAVIPISLVQYFVPNCQQFFPSLILYSLLKSFLLYGLVEELFKMLLILPLPHKGYTPKNFMLLTFVLGLSLGCFENAVYFLQHLQEANSIGAELLYGQIFIRIFTSDIIHMTCTGLSGLFVYSCRNKPRKISPLIWAIILHGVYDFFAGFNSNIRYFSLLVVLMAIIECRVKYMDIKQED